MDAIWSSFSFSREYLHAALLVSLLSVWVLVILFYYLNRYTKRDYFTAWTAAWLFYALWLTLNLRFEAIAPGNIRSDLAQCCVAASSVFLFWGSLRFLEIQFRHTLLGLFLGFVIAWTLVGPHLAVRPLQIQLPVFLLLGSGSIFAGVCFFRLRKRMPFVGAGMLALGFLLWGLYLVTYPFSQQHANLINAGYLAAAVLQLFIAVSMIVLVLEEVRVKAEQAMVEIAAIRLEKESLELKVLSAEENCRSLYDAVRVTEGKQKAYDELRRTQEIIVRQERLRAIGQMASGLVHDLNNLLTPILGYCDIIQSGPATTREVMHDRIGKIRKAAQDIARIASRMRSFYRTRSQQDRLEPTMVNQAINEVAELTCPRWKDQAQRDGISIQVHLELSPQLPLLHCDASELRQALTNLVFNAVDALPRGGNITLASRVIDQPPNNGSKEPTQAIQIEVKDDGTGMDEETRHRCIEPFYSKKSERGGSGLGLAMVYGMVQRQEGELEIESSPGNGTCVRLTLPVHSTQQAERATPPALVSPDHPSESLRVLYIDDEHIVREVIGDCLRFLKHDVTLAPDGTKGLAVFATEMSGPRPFDAVITDLGMPNLSGKDVARAIKAQDPSMPVIILTGWHNAASMQVSRFDENVNAVLNKPPGLKELNETLLRVVHPEFVGAAGQN